MNNAYVKTNQLLVSAFLLLLFSSATAATGSLGIEGEGLNPFDVIALNNRAVSRVESDDHQMALVLLERAARIAPYNLDVQANYDRLKQWLLLQRQGGTAIKTTRLSLFISEHKGSESSLTPEPPSLW